MLPPNMEEIIPEKHLVRVIRDHDFDELVDEAEINSDVTKQKWV